ncbi:MAG: Fur family transcriptional regulator [Candidatus Magasanikbacteria bacterium]
MKEILLQLKQHGYKLTKPREKVLGVLSSNHQAISAQDIHQKIKTVDKVSVYRVLNLLEELGLVNIENMNNEKLYCLVKEPHHHVICKKCGYSEEVACNYSFDEFKNFTNVHHQLTLTGLCKKCSK